MLRTCIVDNVQPTRQAFQSFFEHKLGIAPDVARILLSLVRSQLVVQIEDFISMVQEISIPFESGKELMRSLNEVVRHLDLQDQKFC